MSWEPFPRPSALSAAAQGLEPFPPPYGDSATHPWESAWDSQEPSARYGPHAGACIPTAPKISSSPARGSSRKNEDLPGVVRNPELKWKPNGGVSAAGKDQPDPASSPSSGDSCRSEQGIQPQALRHAPQAPSLLEDLPCSLLHEIFRCLDAKDLGRVSCCCRLFNQLALESPGWQRFYCDRWHPPPSLPRKGSFSRIPSASSLQSSQNHQQLTEATQPKNDAGALKRAASSASAAVSGKSSATAGALAMVPAGVNGCSQGSQAGAERHSGSPEWWRQLYLHKEKRSAALMGR